MHQENQSLELVLVGWVDALRRQDVAIDAFPDRDAALEALHQPDPHAAPKPGRELPSMPAAGRVDGLIPFVRVTDVERSIAFYELLGFEVADTHGNRGQLGWAALESE